MALTKLCRHSVAVALEILTNRCHFGLPTCLVDGQQCLNCRGVGIKPGKVDGVLGRQVALNVGILAAARRAQALDPTAGVAAAAYGIVMQMYSVGIVVHVAMQGTAAALVPATLAKDGTSAARHVADRLFIWNALVGLALAVAQVAALPVLVPLFSTLPAVQDAVQAPAMWAALLHLLNGPVFAGEGVLLGLGSFRDLMLITAGGIATMMLCLASPLARGLSGILQSFAVFTIVQAVAVVLHYLKWGPLAVKRGGGGGTPIVNNA